MLGMVHQQGLKEVALCLCSLGRPKAAHRLPKEGRESCLSGRGELPFWPLLDALCGALAKGL